MYNSDEFKKKANEASHFLTKLKDFTFGRPTTLENIVSLSPEQNHLDLLSDHNLLDSGISTTMSTLS